MVLENFKKVALVTVLLFIANSSTMKGIKMADVTPVETETETIDTDVVEEAIAVSGATDVVAAIQGLNNPDSAFYTSVKGTDFAAKKAVASALTSSEPIDEHLGETINMLNVIVMPVDLANAQGEVNTAPRVIVIAEDGKAYHATSVGMLSAIRNLFATLGEPETWPEAVPIKVVQQKGNNGYKYFTINLV